MSEKMKPSDLLNQPAFGRLPQPKTVPEDQLTEEVRSPFNFPKNSLNKPDPNAVYNNTKKEKEEKEKKEKEEQLTEKKKEESKFINLSKMQMVAIAGAIAIIPGLPFISTAATIAGGIWGINKLMKNKAAMDTFESWKSSLTEKFGNTEIGKGLKDGSIMESVKKLEVPESVQSTLDAGIKNLKEGKPLEMSGNGLKNVGQFLADKAEQLKNDQAINTNPSENLENSKNPKPPLSPRR